MIIVTQSSARSVLWAGLFWTTEIKPCALSFVRAEHKGIIITKHLNIIPQNVLYCKVWYLYTKEVTVLPDGLCDCNHHFGELKWRKPALYFRIQKKYCKWYQKETR